MQGDINTTDLKRMFKADTALNADNNTEEFKEWIKDTCITSFNLSINLNNKINELKADLVKVNRELEIADKEIKKLIEK